MQVISYRGPWHGGGVASLIRGIAQRDDRFIWWYLNENRVENIVGNRARQFSLVHAEAMAGHYRHCNEFLWPLMHEQFDKIRWNESDHNHYRALNLVIAKHLNQHGQRKRVLTHDYQFCFVPEFLHEGLFEQSTFFWHIPWPSECPSGTETQLIELSNALLHASDLGFHTPGFANNFCNFTSKFLPDYSVRSEDRTITHKSGRRTQIHVAPAGIDVDYWQTAGQTNLLDTNRPGRYVLSVERTDYSKGVRERIEAVRKVFNTKAELKGRLTFVFICPTTRTGLLHFDEYWQICREAYNQVMNDFATPDWSPILWLSDGLDQEQVASWYARADALLITAPLDGLNLTAKEFVASSTKLGSVLILSSGAGAWQELGSHCVTIHECQPDQIARAILEALEKPAIERAANLAALKKIVREGDIGSWWKTLTGSSVVNNKPEKKDAATLTLQELSNDSISMR